MSSYILLRSNKESGPHTFADLKNQGLKPNDLIWVEGQSACWLNPGEIRELKPLVVSNEIKTVQQPVLALPVEDRSAEQSFQTKSVQEIQQDNFYQYQPVEKAIDIVVAPVEKKRVFVAMPSNGTMVHKKVEKLEHIPPPMEEPKYVPKKVTVISDFDDEVVTETKYAKPLDEIKELYVKNLMQRKKRSFRLKDLPNGVKQAAVFGGLLLCGVLIGLLLNKTSGKNSKLSQQVQQPSNIKPVSNQETSDLGIKNASNGNIQDPGNQNPTDAAGILDNNSQQTQTVVPNLRKKPLADKKNELTDVNGQSTTLNEEPAERNAINRNEPVETKETPIENISSLVSVNSNNYRVAAFGGVKDLQLTVKNDSKYILDNVVVELQYLKPSEQTLKTETIQFKSVPPNGTQTIAMPKSNRGIKVVYKITRIDSKAHAASLAGL